MSKFELDLKRAYRAWKPTQRAITVESVPPEEAVTPAPSFKSSIDLTSVRGIGAKTAEKLARAGIFTTNDLVKAAPEELAKKANISAKLGIKWIEEARKLLEKV